jgi:hypothetical protein
MVKDNPTTLYIYPEAADIDALARVLAFRQSLSRAGLYWNLSCLKEIGAPKFWPKEILEPILAQYKMDHPAPPERPTPVCKGPSRPVLHNCASHLPGTSASKVQHTCTELLRVLEKGEVADPRQDQKPAVRMLSAMNSVFSRLMALPRRYGCDHPPGPADLPIDQSGKFEFVVNLKTAKSLGVEIPLSVLEFALR